MGSVVSDNIGRWAIGEVMFVIEMVVNESDDRVVFKVGKVVTKEWALANSSFRLNGLGPLCL